MNDKVRTEHAKLMIIMNDKALAGLAAKQEQHTAELMKQQREERERERIERREERAREKKEQEKQNRKDEAHHMEMMRQSNNAAFHARATMLLMFKPDNSFNQDAGILFLILLFCCFFSIHNNLQLIITMQ